MLLQFLRMHVCTILCGHTCRNTHMQTICHAYKFTCINTKSCVHRVAGTAAECSGQTHFNGKNFLSLGKSFSKPSLPQILYITDVVNRPEYMPRNPTSENLPNVFDIRFPEVYIIHVYLQTTMCVRVGVTLITTAGSALSSSDHYWRVRGERSWEDAETDQKHIFQLPIVIQTIPHTYLCLVCTNQHVILTRSIIKLLQMYRNKNTLGGGNRLLVDEVCTYNVQDTV